MKKTFTSISYPPAHLIEPVKQLSWDAYVACKGKGYTRDDIRMNSKTNALFVLEANAKCGISED